MFSIRMVNMNVPLFDDGQQQLLESPSLEVNVEDLINRELWDDAYAHFQQYPEETKRMVDPTCHFKGTFLYWLCSMPSTPNRLIELVASLNPSAVIMADARYGDTPLHQVCRNSQISCEKVQLLLRFCPIVGVGSNGPTSMEGLPDVLTRNIFGGTALHSACNNNAMLDTLELLVRANPSILKVRTHEGIHAISVMWMSYMQTIPGTMTAARFLAGKEVSVEVNSPFERLWQKVEFLSTEYYYLLTQSRKSNSTRSPGNQQHLQAEYCIDGKKKHHQHVLHGLIRCDAPINLYKVALKINPNYALAVDVDGNLPLHVLIENRPYRLKEREAIEATIHACREAAAVRNLAGDLPLFIGIRGKIPWENGLDLIVKAVTCVVGLKDALTNLHPFQYAALQGGRFAVDTTYQLLCLRPDLLSN